VLPWQPDVAAVIDMSKGGNKRSLVGYRVVTEQLLVGAKVYRRGDFIPAEEAGHELDYVYGMKLVEPVFEGDEGANKNGTGNRGKSSSAFAFKRPF
jgi:hypothetical protein